MGAPIAVVTGGAGFVGQALVRRLLGEGDAVRAVVLPGDANAQELRDTAPHRERLEIVEADVTSYDAVAAACAGAARIFHAAALIHAWAPWAAFRAVNVGGLQNVARAAHAHGVGRLVAVSTTDVFGIPIGDEVLDEASPLRAWGEPYADTKIEAERWLWAWHRKSGLPIAVIYPGWVYGPGDKAFFPSLAHAMSSGAMMFWCRDVRLPWVYVDNLVDACLRASSLPTAVGNGYIVHDGDDAPTLQAVCARIAEAVGAPCPRRHVPYAFAYGAAAIAQAAWKLLRLGGTPPLLTVDVKAFGRSWRFSTQKARRDLGWAPRTPVADGLRLALEYLCRHRAARG